MLAAVVRILVAAVACTALLVGVYGPCSQQARHEQRRPPIVPQAPLVLPPAHPTPEKFECDESKCWLVSAACVCRG
jgi:hypothetical protein